MKTTQSYTSEAGNIFTTAQEAWKDDLYHKLYAVIMNEAVTRQTVAAICADLPGYKEILTGLDMPRFEYVQHIGRAVRPVHSAG